MIIFSAKEHENIKKNETEIDFGNLNPKIKEIILSKEKTPSILGLYIQREDDKIKVKSSYFVGYTWLIENKSFIRILPKQNKGKKQANYVAMFLECLNDTVVSKHLSETYKIFLNQPVININRKDDLLSPFLILHFIKVVEKIAKKGLKKGYIKEQKNLTSKIKGKILINQTINKNHLQNRLDRTYCVYKKYTINCLENQIIKTALIQSSKYLSIIKNDFIGNVIKRNLNAFMQVDTKEIFDCDFINIRHSPFYSEYKEALNLAKLIFKLFGYSMQSKILTDKLQIPPFYIDMPELFERYAEVKLRKYYKNELISGYSKTDKEVNSYIWGLRPDFIVKNQNTIIDAKYKYWFEATNNDKFKDDYQQLALYSRIKSLKKDIGNNVEEAQIIFIYPHSEGVDTIDNDKIDSDNNFNINKIKLKIPFE